MIYVDEIRRHPSGLWCHMMTDGDVSELHALAQRIGLKRCWFQNPRPGDRPHYDLRSSMREKALAAGAVECDAAKIVQIMRGRRSRLTKQGALL